MKKKENCCLRPDYFFRSVCFIIILLLCGKISAHAETDVTHKISIHMDNNTMKEVFSYIEKNSKFIFVYNKSKVDLDKKVSININNQTVDAILDKMFHETDLEYFIRGRQVIVRKKNVVEEKEVATGSQQDNTISVRGIVKDNRGEVLTGVSIAVEGTAMGTTTDHNGNFLIDKVRPDAILKFSYVGYRTEHLPLQGRTALSVTLSESYELLNEIVVVGYGSQRKSSLTAAVTTVNTKELANIPNSNVISSLQGRVSGLTIGEWSGEPGTSPNIQIRGIGTIDGSTSPLIVIDGIPGGGRLENIPAYDIESISLLKDASASAIYGARAANGVILVTTKRGLVSTEKPVVEFSSNVGFQTKGTMPETISAYEYAALLQEAVINDGNNPVFDDRDMEMFKTGRIDDLHGGGTDWTSLVIKEVAPIYTNHIGVAGNGKIGRYYFAGEYLYQEGLVKKIDKYDRLNLRANITSDISENVQLQFSSNYTRTHKTASDMYNVFAQVVRVPPIARPVYEDGHYGSMIFAKGNYLADILNPYYWVNSYGPKEYNWNNLLTTANIEYKPINDLVFNILGSYNLVYSDDQHYYPRGESWNPVISAPAQSSENSLNETWNKSYKYDIQATGNYEKTIQKHYFKLLAGFSVEEYRSDYISANRRNFITDTLYELNAGDAATSTNNGSASHWAFASFFGRLNYSFAEKYLLELSFRNDGSSRFAPGKQWGFFPSGSAGWNINKENFMENFDFIDLLKLRGSVGQLGNAEKVGLYLWYSGINNGGYYNFDNSLVVGTRPGSFANRQLSWETTTTYNIGTDGSFWNGKLNFEIDYWKKNTDDILLTTPISTIIGAPSPEETVNAGKVASHGFDLTIGSRGNFTKDFTYNVRLSLTGWNSWIVDLKNRESQFGSFRPGSDLGSMYGYECLGIINDEETLAKYKTLVGVDVNYTNLGDLQYKDQNGDGKIDYKDVVKIGNSNTKNTYGVNIDLGYKDFDFQAFFQGAFNVDRSIAGEIRTSFAGYRSPIRNQLDRWTEENRNPNAEYPRVRKDRSHNWSESDFWVRNGAYLKLKTLQIGYHIPKPILSKVKIDNLRIYMSATNLFTIAPDIPKGFDPQMNVQEFIYPQLRVYSIGLNVKF
ncbi:MAG: TonB-dependent receptor [Dysgonamonadaceae bacterium]|jgi:TonB-linked SusC/RagA family outer membrane protein|nr:TonB-dependent receptor [Dysgonamonadaceae bacterium]